MMNNKFLLDIFLSIFLTDNKAFLLDNLKNIVLPHFHIQYNIHILQDIFPYILLVSEKYYLEDNASDFCHKIVNTALVQWENKEVIVDDITAVVIFF